MFVSRVAVSLGIPGLKKKALVKITRRLKEHKRAVRVGDNNSKVAQDANQFVHSIDFDHATIVDRARNFHERLFLEAWYSQRDSNAGNEHIDIPDVYKSLA